MRATRWMVSVSCAMLAACTALAVQPRVEWAFPDNGDVGVDPATDRLRVTFDEPMDRRGVSVVGGGELFPEITGQISWDGERTVVVPVRLKPDHEYRLWINNARFQNFRNTRGEPAVSYAIRFMTGPGGEATGDETRARNEAALKKAAELLGTAYSHRDRLGIDWAAALDGRREVLVRAPTGQVFAHRLAVVLSLARDKHVWVTAGDDRHATYIHPSVPNVNPRGLREIVPGYERHNDVFAVGRFEDGVGYLAIDTWDSSREGAIEAALEALDAMRSAPGLIIDVRLNGGGDESLAARVAGRFVTETVAYARHESIVPDAPGEFGAVVTRSLEPVEPSFDAPVAVLIGPAVMSSNEAFVLMMRASGATLVGERTQGSSGNPRPHELGNGVTLVLPTWRAMTLDGVRFEGVGIEPDVEVQAQVREFERGDPVLDRALEELRSGRPGDR